MPLAVLLVFVAVVAGLHAPLAALESTPDPVTPTNPRVRTASRVDIGDARVTGIIREALANAARRLEHPGCRAIFSDFTDDEGAPLQARLDGLGLTGAQFLATLWFRNGSSSRVCRRSSALAFTSPGAPVVFVCRPRLYAWGVRAREGIIEELLIHEALHALGLSENPPSSADITAQVQRRCGSRQPSGAS